MKKNLLIIIVLLLLSCEKGGFPPRSYFIEIQITDTNGNDLIDGIRYATPSYIIDEYYPISDSDFNCESKTDKVHVFNADVNIAKNPQTIKFNAATPSHRPNFKPTEITIDMVCYHIFKNTEKHTLTTKWEYIGLSEKYCTSIILDGTEYTPTLIENESKSYFAKIVLNK